MQESAWGLLRSLKLSHNPHAAGFYRRLGQGAAPQPRQAGAQQHSRATLPMLHSLRLNRAKQVPRSIATLHCHARRMLVICSPLSGFLALWGSHCRAKTSSRSGRFCRSLLPKFAIFCDVVPAARGACGHWPRVSTGARAIVISAGGGGGVPSVRRAARPSLIPSLCTRFTRAGIEWRR